GQKIKKTDRNLTVELGRNPDILGGLAEMDLPGLVRVGFAAETQDLAKNALDKLRRKKLDMIVANDATSSIGSDTSALSVITADGKTEQLPSMPKQESARLLVERLAHLINNRPPGG